MVHQVRFLKYTILIENLKYSKAMDYETITIKKKVYYNSQEKRSMPHNGGPHKEAHGLGKFLLWCSLEGTGASV